MRYLKSLKKACVIVLVILFMNMTVLSGCMKKEASKSADLMQMTTQAGHATETIINFNKSIDKNEKLTKEMSSMDMDGAAMAKEKVFRDEAEIPMGYGEGYTKITENSFLSTQDEPVTTFSIDVDTAGYSNMRRFITGGSLPPIEAVRIEEMLNYFQYDYEEPSGTVPFSIHLEHGICPWQADEGIVMIGLRGRDIEWEHRENTNLVFLLDVSGSMNDDDKLPLLKESFRLLTNELSENDRVSIVVYAGASGVVLDGVRGDKKNTILSALDKLEAGGSTAGSQGILQAYELARKYFIHNGNNRVILATDGDFNVGLTSLDELERLIEEKRKEGIFLSVLGFGRGNTQFDKMELLADKGNGQFAYIDSQKEAEKVMIEQMAGTLYTIAKDVKIQVHFNPDVISSYRLLGYENRLLNNEDFEDDSKDAGEIGAGHRVTALYQVQYTDAFIRSQATRQLAEVKLRYKEPVEVKSQEIHRLLEGHFNQNNTSNNFLFATSVAEFGLLLRNSEHKGQAAFGNLIHRLDTRSILDDDYKQEFVKLVKLANEIYRAND